MGVSIAPRRLSGRSASPGVAVGALVRLAELAPTAAARQSIAEAHQALANALAAAQEALTELTAELDDADAQAILALQLALLDDATLTAPAFAAIARGEQAAAAWSAAIDPEIAAYDAANDPYFRARGADLRDLRDRVVRSLAGHAEQVLPPGAIVAADDIPPSRFLATDWGDGGLVLRRGSPTSHVAILARSRGVPMVVGVTLDQVETGQEAALDADAGVLIIDPDPQTRRAFALRRAAQAQARQQGDPGLLGPVVTASGEPVAVLINVAGPAELVGLDPARSDGIGLVRTELLFEGRNRLPDEDEQYAIYRRLLDWAAGRPVTIRTLDAGGDKPLPGLTRPGETNPFLGVRGVRLSLRHPDVFAVQLRALARAAVAGDLKVMVPMVTLPQELSRCRALLDQAVAELTRQRREARSPPLGMMVEVPAAALTIEDFDADFYSIGSNDLIQYVAAASRDEPELEDLCGPSRAVLGLIRRVVDVARLKGRGVSLCGDLAADPDHVALLLDHGLRELSVSPSALGAVKAAVARYRPGV
jgi:phosphoenolpyruvate-protein phosphotransferase (PTS system enzyme I)